MIRSGQKLTIEGLTIMVYHIMGITSPSHSCHLAPSHNDMGHETQNPFTLVNVVRLIYAANIQKHAFLAGFQRAFLPVAQPDLVEVLMCVL